MKTILALILTTTAAIAAESTLPTEGSVAPAFSLPSQEGATVSLDQFRGK